MPAASQASLQHLCNIYKYIHVGGWPPPYQEEEEEEPEEEEEEGEEGRKPLPTNP